MTAPIVFVWDGAAMVPMKRFAKVCDQEFVVHEYYRMDVIEERSWRSHKHYFAALFQGWLNLPENCVMEPWAQTVKHLRAYALIKTGWNTSEVTVCDSDAEATRWATRMRPHHPFGIVVARRNTVVELRPVSQSYAAMGKADFKQSKDDVLDFVADLIGVDRGALEEGSTASAQ